MLMDAQGLYRSLLHTYHLSYLQYILLRVITCNVDDVDAAKLPWYLLQSNQLLLFANHWDSPRRPPGDKAGPMYPKAESASYACNTFSKTWCHKIVCSHIVVSLHSWKNRETSQGTNVSYYQAPSVNIIYNYHHSIFGKYNSIISIVIAIILLVYIMLPIVIGRTPFSLRFLSSYVFSCSCSQGFPLASAARYRSLHGIHFFFRRDVLQEHVKPGQEHQVANKGFASRIFRNHFLNYINH